MNEDAYCPIYGASFEHDGRCYTCRLCYCCCQGSGFGCEGEDDYDEADELEYGIEGHDESA